MKKILLLLVSAFVFSSDIAFSGDHGYGKHQRGHRGFSYGYQQPPINQYIYNERPRFDDCDDDYGYQPQVYNNNYYAPRPVVVRNNYYGQPAYQPFGQPIFQPAFVPAFQPSFGQPNLVPIYPRNSVNVQFGF